jgi:hypothetical protein
MNEWSKFIIANLTSIQSLPRWMVADGWPAEAACLHTSRLLMWDTLMAFATIWIVNKDDNRKHKDHLRGETTHEGQGLQCDV